MFPVPGLQGNCDGLILAIRQTPTTAAGQGESRRKAEGIMNQDKDNLIGECNEGIINATLYFFENKY